MKQKIETLQEKIQRGETLFEEGKISQAETLFLDDLDEDLENAEILNNLGVIHYYKGEIPKAQEYFLKVLSIEEGHSDAIKNLDFISADDTCKLGENISDPEKLKVSIGIPVYNGEDFIAGSIESLLSQEYSNYEILIVDNDSSDNTVDICQKFAAKDSRIKYIKNHGNVGSTRNFSRAFELSSGEYFMWASADDTFETDYVKNCVDVLEKDPSVALCYSWTNIIDSNGSLITVYKDKFNLNDNNSAKRYLELIYHLDLCNCLHGLIRASVLSNTKMIQPESGAWDCVLLAEIALRGKFVQIQKPMFNRRRFVRDGTYEQRHARSAMMRWPHIENKRTIISLPICRMIRAHVAAINDSNIAINEKEVLIKETYRCFLKRFENMIKGEVGRAIKLIHMGVFQDTGVRPLKPSAFFPEYSETGKTYIYDLLSEMDYALFLMPGYPCLQFARSILLINLGRLDEARIALSCELKTNPSLKIAQNLLERLDSKISNK